MEPDELRAEQRWSNIPQHSVPNGYWSKQLDEKLLVLVTSATASGDRFPVGVNWLDISRSIGYAPVECVKRYAFLHNARGRLSGQMPSLTAKTGGLHHQHQQHAVGKNGNESGDDEDDEVHNPFAGLSSSDDLSSPNSRAFLEYGSPLASPRLQSLENSDEFAVGCPSSPPPFALRAGASKTGQGVSSPLRWESLAKETYSASPILKPPPHVLRQQQLRTSFGVGEMEETASKQAAYEDVQSPRIVFGTQHHSKFTDPNFAADIVNHAFKGLRFDEDLPPSGTSSPRMIRTISNSDFPFLRDDDHQRTPKQQVAPSTAMEQTPQLGDIPLNPRARPLSVVQNTPPIVGSPGSPMLASFAGGDNPFTGSLTQSALEEAFLDMAGSRLDASSTSMLFASRYAASQSRLPTDQTPPRQQQQPNRQQDGSRSGPRK